MRDRVEWSDGSSDEFRDNYSVASWRTQNNFPQSSASNMGSYRTQHSYSTYKQSSHRPEQMRAEDLAAMSDSDNDVGSYISSNSRFNQRSIANSIISSNSRFNHRNLANSVVSSNSRFNHPSATHSFISSTSRLNHRSGANSLISQKSGIYRNSNFDTQSLCSMRQRQYHRFGNGFRKPRPGYIPKLIQDIRQNKLDAETMLEISRALDEVRGFKNKRLKRKQLISRTERQGFDASGESSSLTSSDDERSKPSFHLNKLPNIVPTNETQSENNDLNKNYTSTDKNTSPFVFKKPAQNLFARKNIQKGLNNNVTTYSSMSVKESQHIDSIQKTQNTHQIKEVQQRSEIMETQPKMNMEDSRPVNNIKGLQPTNNMKRIQHTNKIKESQLINKPGESQPANKPKDPENIYKPMKNLPTNKPKESLSTNKPKESLPANKPKESLPTNKTKESLPTNKAKESLPTNKTKESLPTNKTKESLPTNKPKESLPTNKTKESWPTNIAKQLQPTNNQKESQIANKPIESQLNDEIDELFPKPKAFKKTLKQTAPEVKNKPQASSTLLYQSKCTFSENPEISQLNSTTANKSSFIKRKLFTQTLDILDNANNNNSIDSPEVQIASKEQRRIKNIVSGSCLNVDVFKEDTATKLFDCLEKLGASDRFSSTRISTSSKGSIIDKRFSGKRDPKSLTITNIIAEMSENQNVSSDNNQTSSAKKNGIYHDSTSEVRRSGRKRKQPARYSSEAADGTRSEPQLTVGSTPVATLGPTPGPVLRSHTPQKETPARNLREARAKEINYSLTKRKKLTPANDSTISEATPLRNLNVSPVKEPDSLAAETRKKSLANDSTISEATPVRNLRKILLSNDSTMSESTPVRSVRKVRMKELNYSLSRPRRSTPGNTAATRATGVTGTRGPRAAAVPASTAARASSEATPRARGRAAAAAAARAPAAGAAAATSKAKGMSGTAVESSTKRTPSTRGASFAKGASSAKGALSSKVVTSSKDTSPAKGASSAAVTSPVRGASDAMEAPRASGAREAVGAREVRGRGGGGGGAARLVLARRSPVARAGAGAGAGAGRPGVRARSPPRLCALSAADFTPSKRRNLTRIEENSYAQSFYSKPVVVLKNLPIYTNSHQANRDDGVAKSQKQGYSKENTFVDRTGRSNPRYNLDTSKRDASARRAAQKNGYSNSSICDGTMTKFDRTKLSKSKRGKLVEDFDSEDDNASVLLGSTCTSISNRSRNPRFMRF